MITTEEEKFLQFWEHHRGPYSSTLSKLLRGLPVASYFGIPILLFIGIVYFFMPDWYMKISKSSPQTFLVVFIAVFILIVFYAYFRMHFKWEMNEQLYKELTYKKQKSEAAKT
jgi:cbb3-type cytochrome oxidase subunit 3